MIIPSFIFKVLPDGARHYLIHSIYRQVTANGLSSRLPAGIIVVLFCFVFTFSCKEQDTGFYSNDPGINEFVKLKKSELADIPVDTLLNYDVQVQRAIFSSWTPEKKSEAWRYRLGKILSESDFNPQEFIHLQRLINSVSPELFLIPDNGNDSFLTFKSEWINYSVNELNWSETFIAFLVYRFWLNQEQFSEELSEYETDGSETNPVYCHCNTMEDFCQDALCNSGGCTYAPEGCGWFWSQPCDGRCR